jgi:hypothetical protein
MLYQLKDDEYTDERNEDEGDKEHLFGDALKPVFFSCRRLRSATYDLMHVARNRRASDRQQLFSIAFHMRKPPAHDENSDDRQANTDKGCGNRENVDDDIELDEFV